MRAFACGTCRSQVFFENVHCVTCGSALGFDRARADLVVLDGTSVRCVNHELAEGSDPHREAKRVQLDPDVVGSRTDTHVSHHAQLAMRFADVVVGARRVESRP